MNPLDARDQARRNALTAYTTILRYGRDYCVNPDRLNDVDESEVFAAGLSDLINHTVNGSLEIAVCLVEDVNYHRMAEVIRNWDDFTVEELVGIMK